MYSTTFYSYKGGVGRTTALINVAAELSRRGRKVLVVDFDLEAPGITSYDFCAKAATTPGVVDYICEYIKTSTAPSIDRFIHKCSLAFEGDALDLWVMPAGLQDKKYKARLHSINWARLYAEQSGYLLLENLKAQWAETIEPDYVLIDSRTGHTDVSGICTRQLPDAVVFTFKPNRQNLTGLKQIVEEVSSEKEGPRKKNIYKHFVASDVPRVDDEHKILENTLALFKAELGYKKRNTVYHSDSLDLVDQVIFTLGHRRTRLAQDYVKLTDAIIMQNAEDADGARAYLLDIRKNRTQHSWLSITGRLTVIEENHPTDETILSALGEVYEAYDHVAAAITFYEQSIASGVSPPDTYRSLGILYLRAERRADAIEVFRKVLKRPGMEPYAIQGALRILITLDDKLIPELLELPSIRSLASPEKLTVVEDLRVKPSLLLSALAFAHDVIDSPSTDEKWRDFAKSLIPLMEISLGRYRAAMDHLGTREDVLASEHIQLPFNYAMAEWIWSGTPPIDLFGRVVDLDGLRSEDEEYTANYYQCLAVAAWAIGSRVAAKTWLDKARVLVNAPGFRDREFSCWRYLNVRPDEFSWDILQIGKLLEGEAVLPEFATRDKNDSH